MTEASFWIALAALVLAVIVLAPRVFGWLFPVRYVSGANVLRAEGENLYRVDSEVYARRFRWGR